MAKVLGLRGLLLILFLCENIILTFNLQNKLLEAKVTVPSAIATLLALAPSFNAKQGGGLKLLGIVPTSVL